MSTRLRQFPALLVAALLLAGCADRPMQPAARPDAPTGSAAVAAAPALASDLVIYDWPSRGRARAVILALHGFGDSGELTYAGAAHYWAGRGIVVYAPDQRGFGANSSRQQWPGADALAADAVALAAQIRARHPGLPLVVVGHSMGGGVALAAAGAGMQADALVLAAPAIAGGNVLNPMLRLAAWIAAALDPDRRWTGSGVVSVNPSDNVEAMRRVSRDPRHFANPSSRELFGLIHVLDRAAGAAPQVRLPTLTLVGLHDEFVSPDEVRRVHALVPGAAGFVLYPEGWHWLFRDHQASRVWQDVAEFALTGAVPR